MKSLDKSRSKELKEVAVYFDIKKKNETLFFPVLVGKASPTLIRILKEKNFTIIPAQLKAKKRRFFLF